MKGDTIQVLNAPLDFLWGNKYPERYPELTGKKKRTETETQKNKKETETINKGVKTGDNTPILQWVIVLAAAMAGIGGAFVLMMKRRRRG